VELAYGGDRPSVGPLLLVNAGAQESMEWECVDPADFSCCYSLGCLVALTGEKFQNFSGPIYLYRQSFS